MRSVDQHPLIDVRYDGNGQRRRLVYQIVFLLGKAAFITKAGVTVETGIQVQRLLCKFF
jgi:hypothetical protein